MALKATAVGAATATEHSLEEFGLVMLTERVKRAQWKRDSKTPWMFSHHRHLFGMRQTVPTGHASDRDAIWCLNLHTPIFSQHVCKNTQLSTKKRTRARSHCLFVLVSSQKTLTHGNLAWQPVLVQCISRNDNSPHDPFVTLLMFLHVFGFAFSQGPRGFWQLMHPASAKPGALDRPFRFFSP